MLLWKGGWDACLMMDSNFYVEACFLILGISVLGYWDHSRTNIGFPLVFHVEDDIHAHFFVREIVRHDIEVY